MTPSLQDTEPPGIPGRFIHAILLALGTAA